MKRLFDLVLAGVLTIILAPVMLCIFILILIKDGRPVLYISERMKGVNQPFLLYKFRTMDVVGPDQDTGISGGDKTQRITSLGVKLRKFRIDELPQLFNVLRGDMSIVGPRPPLRQYTSDFPDVYSQVLKSRPGVTGLASLVYHKHEEMIIAETLSSEETDRVYRRRCLPRKAKLDLIYQNQSSICFDIKIIYRTIGRVFSR